MPCRVSLRNAVPGEGNRNYDPDHYSTELDIIFIATESQLISLENRLWGHGQIYVVE